MVIGVHTPEFEFEKNLDNVRRAVEGHADRLSGRDRQRLRRSGARSTTTTGPRSTSSMRRGSIRHHQFGEGEYEESEKCHPAAACRSRTAGRVDHDWSRSMRQGAEAPPDWASLRSPENYLGYERTENFASPGGARTGQAQRPIVPGKLRLNQWAACGQTGRSASRRPRSNKANGRIAYRFHARDLHLVHGTGKRGKPRALPRAHRRPAAGRRARRRRRRAGQRHGQRTAAVPADPAAGADRRSPFEIEFLDPGVEAFAFTFG